MVLVLPVVKQSNALRSISKPGFLRLLCRFRGGRATRGWNMLARADAE
jgi:hypothetical protein